MVIESLFNVGDIFRLEVECKKKGGFTKDVYSLGTEFQVCGIVLKVRRDYSLEITYAFCHPYEEPYWLLEKEQNQVIEIMKKIGWDTVKEYNKK